MEATRFDSTLRVLLGRRRARQSSTLDSTLSLSHPINPATMTTIDHLFFPHIIDQIWSYLSVSDLKHVRTVSKSWLVRSDLSLSNYIVIERKNKWGCEARARCLAHGEVTTVITKEFEDGCSCSVEGFGNVGEDGKFDGTTCRLCHRLLHYPTIDIVGHTPNSMDIEETPFDMIPEEATIRWFTDFRAESKLDWYLSFGSDHVFFLQHDGTSETTVTFELDYDPIRPSVDLVFNFNCTANPAAATAPAHITVPQWQELECRGCFVFIFHDKRTEKKEVFSINPAFIVGLLRAYLDVGISVSVVGLESFIDTTATMRGFELTVFCGVLDYYAEIYSEHCEDFEEMCLEDWESVSFLTMEEYAEKIGQEKFLIHTVK